MMLKDTVNFIDTVSLATKTLSARQMAGWNSMINNSSTMESELWRNADSSAFQLQETRLGLC